MTELTTERLLLRAWKESDYEPFAALNADPAVMAHFPAPMTRGESDGLIDRISSFLDEKGFGLWALEVLGTGQFIGFTGLSVRASRLISRRLLRSAGDSQKMPGATAMRARPPGPRSGTRSDRPGSTRWCHSRPQRTSPPSG